MTVVLLCCSWGKDEDTAAAAAAEDEACAVDGDCFEMVLATTLARVQMIHVMVNRNDRADDKGDGTSDAKAAGEFYCRSDCY